MWLVMLSPVLATMTPRERFQALSGSEASPAEWWIGVFLVTGLGLVSLFLLWAWWRQRRRNEIPLGRLRAFREACLECGLTRSEADSLWRPAYAVSPTSPANILTDKRLFYIAVEAVTGIGGDVDELPAKYARIAEKISFSRIAEAAHSEAADVVAKATANEVGRLWEFNARIIESMENSMKLTHHGIAEETDALEEATDLRSGDAWYAELPTDYADVGEMELAFKRADIGDVFRQKLRLRSSEVPGGRGSILLKVGLGEERDPMWVIGHVPRD